MSKHFWRTYCKHCNDITLFESQKVFVVDTLPEETGEKREWCCQTCKRVWESVKIKDIPENLLLEQRERYKKQRKEKLAKSLNYFQSFGHSNYLSDMFSEVKPKYHEEVIIDECDLGLESEENAKRQRIENIKKERKEELHKFKDVQRNDLCLCGSGKKYKKCCEVKHSTW